MENDNKKTAPISGEPKVIYVTSVSQTDEENKRRLTPIKAIRAKCLDCCCDSWLEVKLCPSRDCALYPYRLGHRPRSYETLEEIPEESLGCPELSEIIA